MGPDPPEASEGPRGRFVFLCLNPYNMGVYSMDFPGQEYHFKGAKEPSEPDARRGGARQRAVVPSVINWSKTLSITRPVHSEKCDSIGRASAEPNYQRPAMTFSLHSCYTTPHPNRLDYQVTVLA